MLQHCQHQSDHDYPQYHFPFGFSNVAKVSYWGQERRSGYCFGPSNGECWWKGCIPERWPRWSVFQEVVEVVPENVDVPFMDVQQQI